MFPDLLRERLAGVADLSDEQVAVLESHYERMVRWNRTVNLTTITDLGEVVERHYGESLFLARHLPAGPLGIVDIGSGPGFPGFPVAVWRPDCEVVLVESHQRKAVFLKEACRELGNVRVMASRGQDVSGSFDWAISRAVSYRDLRGVLRRLGRRAMLLTGVESPPADLSFEWLDPIPLPSGKGRFLRVSE